MLVTSGARRSTTLTWDVDGRAHTVIRFSTLASDLGIVVLSLKIVGVARQGRRALGHRALVPVLFSATVSLLVPRPAPLKGWRTAS
jgi:hypothetical protein